MDNPQEVVAESRHNSTYIVDLMAALRSMVQIPENYEELTWKLLSSFPKGFQRVDIVADTYRNVSIKAGEREIRRRNDKVIIKSTNSKVPKDFQAFLRKGENKNRLTDLLCGTVSSSSNRALPILPTSVIYFSKEDSCVRVNASQVTAVNELSSNQEEADTMVLLHSAHAISTAEGSIILRSSSGDIDIMIMAISLIKRVLVDYGNGKNRKGVWLNSMDLDDNIRAALIGFHVFTGNDYVSSFFKHDK